MFDFSIHTYIHACMHAHCLIVWTLSKDMYIYNIYLFFNLFIYSCCIHGAKHVSKHRLFKSHRNHTNSEACAFSMLFDSRGKAHSDASRLHGGARPKTWNLICGVILVQVLCSLYSASRRGRRPSNSRDLCKLWATIQQNWYSAMAISLKDSSRMLSINCNWRCTDGSTAGTWSCNT